MRVQSGFAFQRTSLTALKSNYKSAQVHGEQGPAFFERTGSSGTAERVGEFRQQSDQDNSVCERERVQKTRVPLPEGPANSGSMV